jgi:hypothetical protein
MDAYGTRQADPVNAAAEGGAGAVDGSADSLAEEEEQAQELQEVTAIAGMGYTEQDARRALQPRRKLADAWREWHQDETAQQAYEKADDEGRTKALEEVRSANIATNVENAVEKLLSGAIATTEVEPRHVEPQPIARQQLRATDAAKEGEEDKTQNRRLSASNNAPTAEEIAKGLSRKIQCVLPCEEQKRVYVGTDEGQVLCHSCDANFTIRRWITQPGPNVVAVTCLDAVYESKTDDPWGLLLVGTQDGSAHLYGMPNLRLAGSIHIGRVLPDATPEGGDLALRHVKLMWIPKDTVLSIQFPLAVMTVDKRSRFRFWGIRLNSQSGKLEELALLLDGGQLGEIKEDVVNPYAEEPEGDDTHAAEAAPKEKKDSKKVEAKVADFDIFRPPAKITTVCAVKGQVVLPINAVPGAQLPGQEVLAEAAKDKEAPAISAAFAALAAASANAKILKPWFALAA